MREESTDAGGILALQLPAKVPIGVRLREAPNHPLRSQGQGWRMTGEQPLAGSGRRIAIASIAISAALAALKITVGFKANSTALVSDGFESASDVLSSSIVLIGLVIAARPPDHDHPYGHGRFEILSALFVGAILAGHWRAHLFPRSSAALEPGHAPQFFAVWPLLISIGCKACCGG